MTDFDYRILIQARMSSSRFPGKVLAPINNKPLIQCLLERLETLVPRERLLLVTSTHPTDDPLACYVEHIGYNTFRGVLENVYNRFRRALEMYPCDYFFRICGDSPFFDAQLVPWFLSHAKHGHFDLMTNLFPRTFPKGMSLELVKSPVFASWDEKSLTSEECEHVTKYFYNHPERFSIRNLEAQKTFDENANFAVDTLDDLKTLEQMNPHRITVV